MTNFREVNKDGNGSPTRFTLPAANASKSECRGALRTKRKKNLEQRRLDKQDYTSEEHGEMEDSRQTSPASASSAPSPITNADSPTIAEDRDRRRGRTSRTTFVLSPEPPGARRRYDAEQKRDAESSQRRPAPAGTA